MIGAELLSPETLTVGWLIYIPALIHRPLLPIQQRSCAVALLFPSE